MNPETLVLYVADPARSARFYADLFGYAPVESHPNFVMFAAPNGFKLGLWSRADAQPAPASPGGSEIVIVDIDPDAIYAAWQAKGIAIAQAPVTMDFGRTFLALDPDGHRIRVFAPSEK